MKALMYDRDPFNGAERLLKNARAITEATPHYLGLQLETYGRHKRFCAEPGAEESLCQEPFPYKAVIINMSASHADSVCLSARTGLEYNQLPFDSLILLCPPGFPLQDDGVQYITTHGGNGYLLPDDAKYAARLLETIKNGQLVH